MPAFYEGYILALSTEARSSCESQKNLWLVPLPGPTAEGIVEEELKSPYRIKNQSVCNIGCRHFEKE